MIKLFKIKKKTRLKIKILQKAEVETQIIFYF